VFRDNLELQGGDVRLLEDPSLLGRAPHIVAVEAMRSGFVTDVDPLALGHAVVDLGGGRRQPSDAVDPHVGIVLRKVLGDEVRTGDVLAFVHGRTDLAARDAAQSVLEAMPIGEERVKRRALIKKRMA